MKRTEEVDIALLLRLKIASQQKGSIPTEVFYMKRRREEKDDLRVIAGGGR